MRRLVDLLTRRGRGGDPPARGVAVPVALVLCLTALLAAACATGGEGGGDPSPRAGSPDPEEVRRDSTSDAATRSASRRMVQRGRLRLEAGRPTEAVAILERAVRLDPSNGHAYLHLARARLALGDEVGARGLLERAVDLLGASTEEAARADSLLSTLKGGG